MQQKGGSTISAQKGSSSEPTIVPNSVPETPVGDVLKISSLQHQLKENESQRVEITGYVNQLGIQLHRWQLRLQTLKERREKLQAEFAAISGPTVN